MDINTKLSTDMKRAYVEMPFGYACYEGIVENGFFSGAHSGIVGTKEDAEKWLLGDPYPSMIRVYKPERVVGKHMPRIRTDDLEKCVSDARKWQSKIDSKVGVSTDEQEAVNFINIFIQALCVSGALMYHPDNPYVGWPDEFTENPDGWLVGKTNGALLTPEFRKYMNDGLEKLAQSFRMNRGG